ncbi:hypothetical protein AIIKEEIJ_03283 [Rhodococcus sp. YH1]|nr:hypothetical protein [Rhodococcus sp. YH1]
MVDLPHPALLRPYATGIRGHVPVRRARHQPVVRAGARPARGGTGEPQADRVVDPHGVPGRIRDLQRIRGGVGPQHRRGDRSGAAGRGGRAPARGVSGVLHAGSSRGGVEIAGRPRRRARRRHPDRVGARGIVPRHPAVRRAVAVGGQPGDRPVPARQRPVQRAPTRIRQHPARPAGGAGADRGGDRAVPVATGDQRTDRERRIRDPGPARAWRRRFAGLLRDPPRQGGRLRAQR